MNVELAADAVPLDLDKAEHGYRQALAMAEELGMRPLVAECRFGLGRLYRRVGDGARAGEHLRAAAALFKRMGMQLWLEQALAEGTALGSGSCGGSPGGGSCSLKGALDGNNVANQTTDYQQNQGTSAFHRSR